MSNPLKLTQFLKEGGKTEIKLSFSEVATILGEDLPPSAWKYNAWWSNNPSNNPRTQGWLDAGFHTRDLNFAAQTVVFFKFKA